jgi:hypothetical protein
MSDYLGHVDGYLPVAGVPSAQQYDNYGIYDLFCSDIIYQSLVVLGKTIPAPVSKLNRNFLAVERVSPYGLINCDFEAIALIYP